MALISVSSYLCGRWVEPGPNSNAVFSAVDGSAVASVGNPGVSSRHVIDHGAQIGGPALRAMTFHDRARMIKALALYLNEHKAALYDLSFATGATKSDAKIDVDGGIGTLFVFASKTRREMPDDHIYSDGDIEMLSGNGTFLGQHIYTPRTGVGVHINAFNFPVWGMLEKLAPAIIAGQPVIVKPATTSAYVAHKCVQLITESGLLPESALQFVSGSLGDLLDHLGPQDSVAFTGSAKTANALRSNPNLQKNAVRFTAEQDSLNACILGSDVKNDDPEFEILIKEVITELTAKAGQKCTAIRRIMVPIEMVDIVANALKSALGKVKIGDPRDPQTDMGPLVSIDQKKEVQQKIAQFKNEAECVFGQERSLEGAYIPPHLFICHNPDTAEIIHNEEAFGPVATIMGYRDLAHAADLANRGGGSLVTSLITSDAQVARTITLGVAPWHGRVYINNRDSVSGATGHGSPLPHMVHGGPGRAGGGEELGGIRAVLHNMQRTAIQGSADMIAAITGTWVQGSKTTQKAGHPFRHRFADLGIGQTLHTATRTITLDDIEHFAEFTGDTFYAHMDEDAAQRNPFFPGRVAHGYLLLSFAAGLFVEPSEGPVLANTGLDNLRFMKPVQPGDSIRAQLTVKRKTKRNEEYGEVRWQVSLFNQDGAVVGEYDLLTMVAY